MQALAPALDRVYEQQAHSVLRQKVRVVLGDAALAQAEASGSSLREQTKEFRRRLEAAPDGAIPFLQLFNPNPNPNPDPNPNPNPNPNPIPIPNPNRDPNQVRSPSSSSSTRGGTRRTCCR